MPFLLFYVLYVVSNFAHGESIGKAYLKHINSIEMKFHLANGKIKNNK
jgi:hypothetical protein